MTRTCLDCPSPISAESKGRCRACACRELARRPGLVEKRNAKTTATRRDPIVRERHAKATRAAKQASMAKPGMREKLQKLGREVGVRNFWRNGDAAAQEAGRDGIRAQRLSWCPRAYWPLNAELKRKHLSLEHRKELIEARIAADERARLAAMTPFERQLEAVRTGRARVIDKPNLRPSGPAYSLTGNSMGML